MPEVPVKRAKKTKSSGTEVVADLAAKTPRIDTKEISYSMFRQGMDIEEIARKRELVTGTIAGHLEHYVRSGAVKVDQLVSREKVDKINPLFAGECRCPWHYVYKISFGRRGFLCGYSIGDGLLCSRPRYVCRITTKKIKNYFLNFLFFCSFACLNYIIYNMQIGNKSSEVKWREFLQGMTSLLMAL